jgi:hypothetical protein
VVPANRWKLLAFGLAASILALGLGGGFFVEPSRYLRHLEFLTGRLRAAPEAGGLIPFAFPYTVDGNLAYAAQIGGYLADTLTSAGLLLSVAGLVWAVRRHAPSRVIACLVVGFLGFNFVVLRSGQLRYVLPAGFLLALFAGYATSQIWESRSLAVRALLAILAVVALGLNLLRGIDLTYAMLHDSRWEAAAWLAERTDSGDLIEYFGASQKLPPLERGVVTDRATEYRGLFNVHRVDAAKVEEILERWRGRKPKFVIVMPDHTSRPGAPFDISVPPRSMTIWSRAAVVGNSRRCSRPGRSYHGSNDHRSTIRWSILRFASSALLSHRCSGHASCVVPEPQNPSALWFAPSQGLISGHSFCQPSRPAFMRFHRPAGANKRFPTDRPESYGRRHEPGTAPSGAGRHCDHL